MRLRLPAALILAGWTGAFALGASQSEPPLEVFAAAAGTDAGVASEALERLRAGWRDGYAGMLIDLARLMPSPRQPGRKTSESSSATDVSAALERPVPRQGAVSVQRRSPASD